MRSFQVGGLEFEFDDDWKVGAPDEWAYYRRQFSTMWKGIRAVDLMAIDPSQKLRLSEAKNYLVHRRQNPEALDLVVGTKVFCTLAATLPASLHAADADEQALAGAALDSESIQVVLHLEQPDHHSKLFPRAIDPADVLQKMRKRLKPIDPHPRVVDCATPMPWRVSRTR